MQRRRGWWQAMGAAALLVGVPSCGSSSGGGDAGPPSDLGQPTDGALDVGPTDTGSAMDAGSHCTANGDCNGNPAGGVCNSATGACVQCVASADTCPASQHCSAASSTCVPGCRSNDGCVGADGGVPDGGDAAVSAAYCNTANNTCVQCLMDDQCAPGNVCASNVCVPGCAADQPCPTGQSCCGGSCIDLQTAPSHCGACGTTCMTSNDMPACVAGACTVGTCAAGYADCDGMVADGCEVATDTSLANCGACGSVCAPANATPVCTAGACAIASCMGVYADCDTMPANGCEVDTATSLPNCGTCGHACPTVANSAPTCVSGTCGFTCATNYADCDMATANGCEVDTQTDANNCGGCGRACTLGRGCTAGVCQFGSGTSGPLTVTGAMTIDTTATAIAGIAGSSTLTAPSATGIVAGQELLLHQTQSATGAVGQYEYVTVAHVVGTTITTASPLANTYLDDATDHAQAIVVPQYTTVTVAAGGTLTAPAWNGTTGGILVFDAVGAVTVNGSVSMEGRGYRGFQRSCGMPLVHCSVGFAGESSLGPGQSTIRANGAGGGGGGAGQDCGAGGGGGYAVGGDQGTSGTVPGVCGVAGGDGLIPPGDGGGAVGMASLAGSFLFGSAGGEGGMDEDGALPGAGGNGGGAVLVRAASVTVATTATVSASGTVGGTGSSLASTCAGATGCGMGGGGGGAGGAVRIVTVATASLGTGRVVASGGDGGECSCAGGNYPGGNGSYGRVGVLAATVVGSTTPALDPH